MHGNWGQWNEWKSLQRACRRKKNGGLRLSPESPMFIMRVDKKSAKEVNTRWEKGEDNSI